MDDVDYDQLAPGIRETVRWLRGAGFETTDSGDGVTNQAEGMECASAWDCPMVAMEVDPADMASEADRLWELLGNDPLLPLPAEIQVQASYDPRDGIAVIVLTGLDDAGLRRLRRS